MAWKALAAPRYNHRRKRLAAEIRRLLTREEDRILEDPRRGDPKRGVLSDIWVEKFKAQNDQYLIAYQIEDKVHGVIFLDIGRHENFYRDLEKYIRTRQ